MERDGILLRRRAWHAGAALLMIGVAAGVAMWLSATDGWASPGAPGKHHPPPSPTPLPTLTPPPRPTPIPTPPPTPRPAPQPTPAPITAPSAKPAPVAQPATAPPLQPSPSAAGSSLPFTGPSIANADQAMLLSPTPRDAVAVDPGNGSTDAQSILWVIVVAFLAIPATIMMALIATVLIRR